MRIEKKLKSNKGFTLVELVVVIAVLAILAGVGTAAYSGYITRANKAADEAQLETIQTAVVSALAKEGKVTEITVSKDGTSVQALVKDGSKVYKLAGSSKDEDSYVSDYEMFIKGNTISFKSKDYKDKGAHWTSDGWVAETTNLSVGS